MRRLDINLKENINKFEIKVNQNIHNFKISMGDTIHRIHVSIDELTNRIFVGMHHAFAVVVSVKNKIIFKFRGLAHTFSLNAVVGGRMRKTTETDSSFRFQLRASIVDLVKKCGIANINYSQLSSSGVSGRLIKFRNLGEMDSNGVSDLYLSDFDDMILCDVDYTVLYKEE